MNMRSIVNNNAHVIWDTHDLNDYVDQTKDVTDQFESRGSRSGTSSHWTPDPISYRYFQASTRIDGCLAPLDRLPEIGVPDRGCHNEVHGPAEQLL